MLTDDSLIDWASGWVQDEPPGQRARFVEALRHELDQRAKHAPPDVLELRAKCAELSECLRESNAMVGQARSEAYSEGAGAVWAMLECVRCAGCGSTDHQCEHSDCGLGGASCGHPRRVT